VTLQKVRRSQEENKTFVETLNFSKSPLQFSVSEIKFQPVLGRMEAKSNWKLGLVLLNGEFCNRVEVEDVSLPLVLEGLVSFHKKFSAICLSAHFPIH